MGGLINTPSFEASFNTTDANTLGNIVSLYDLGCFAGAMSTFVIGSYLGRRRSILLGSIWLLVGAIIQSACNTVGVMIAGRIIAGVGMGIVNATVPVLQAEMSPALTRGQLVGLDLVVLNCGIVLSYWVDYGFNFSDLTGAVTWRVPLALQCVFIVTIFLIALILPDTPRWYASQGRNEEALIVLARMRNRSGQDEQVQIEFNNIQQTITHENAVKKAGYFSIIKPNRDSWRDDNLQTRKRLGLACFIQGAQQLGGVNGIIYYSSTLFTASVGLQSEPAAVLSGGLNCMLILGSIISIFLVDRIGRRPLLLNCISIMALIFVIQTILVSKIQNGTANATETNAAVAMLFLFDLFFSLGFQATVWLIPSEVLPLSIRTQGSALSTASNWICNFAVVKFTPSALANIGYQLYIIFAILNAAWVPIIYFFLPETKGKVLEEIDEIFAVDGWQLMNSHGGQAAKVAQKAETFNKTASASEEESIQGGGTSVRGEKAEGETP
jgi:sugar porter (SP) family MFS transporter